MMTDWYDKTIQALQPTEKGEHTQEAYARSVRMFSQFYGKTPDQISEQKLQDYFIHLGILRCLVDKKSGGVCSPV
jgi:hypothetical protein